jgi:hypothetical protein
MPNVHIPGNYLNKRFFSRRPIEVLPPGQQERHIFVTLTAPVLRGNPGSPHYNNVFKLSFIFSQRHFFMTVCGGIPFQNAGC